MKTEPIWMVRYETPGVFTDRNAVREQELGSEEEYARAFVRHLEESGAGHVNIRLFKKEVPVWEEVEL